MRARTASRRVNRAPMRIRGPAPDRLRLADPEAGPGFPGRPMAQAVGDTRFAATGSARRLARAGATSPTAASMNATLTACRSPSLSVIVPANACDVISRVV